VLVLPLELFELLEPPIPWRAMVPIVVGLVGCGVTVSMPPETQYENFVPSEFVSVFPDVV
jgi:hypothetical protein